MENDNRGQKMILAYNGLPFSVPKNLYIIGMMNTADRSLAMIDYALRRRFSFYKMNPAFESEGFGKYQRELNSIKFDRLIQVVQELNETIAGDASLGEGFVIGHSYFCGEKICLDNWLREILEYDLIPILEEYWFDDSSRAKLWANKMRGVLND
jgi:5-methylcytosine-specific restriction protein B